ncbi:amidase domain-containing protein [Paenibacillus kobensis]|uniref:amidase domain-containing protein n=1 Tax=Paenibacillus kobensis TaxID=59841 RepID=UPI000FDA571B|nr:amidase domain-containing protein [Paenibacillus kobensis]
MPRSTSRAVGRRGAGAPRSAQPQRPPAVQEPKQQLEGWKSGVHAYIKRFNQAEVDQHPSVFDGLITDGDHLLRLGSRLERLRERDLLRGVLSSRSETKAEIVRVNESASETTVMLKLRIKRIMEQKSRSYTEERLEHERIWLARDGRDWVITRVEPVVSERRPRFGANGQSPMPEESELWTEAAQRVIRPPSAPFLNYDILPEIKYRAKQTYRRDLVAAYADRWWNEGNPSYELFEVNCTNYVSQCIFAGHAPMNYTGKRDSGWWYQGRNGGREMWSYSWAVANAMHSFLASGKKNGFRATVVDSADQLQLGDVICYDWNGDYRYQHSTVVTAFDVDGMPLVNANTVASRHRYWDYQDSYAWTDKTRYRLFHIADQF